MSTSSSREPVGPDARAGMFDDFLPLLGVTIVGVIGDFLRGAADRQFQRIQEDSAVDTLARRYRARVVLLQERMKLARVEEEARVLGVDLDQIEQECRDTRDGLRHVDKTTVGRRTLGHE